MEAEGGPDVTRLVDADGDPIICEECGEEVPAGEIHYGCVECGGIQSAEEGRNCYNCGRLTHRCRPEAPA